MQSLSDMALERVQDEVRTVAAHLARYMARYLELIGELDRRKLLDEGFRSLADWLSYHTGASATTSREHLRVARALRELPTTRGALARGELSYSKIRAMTRVATPQNETRLADIARHATAAQVERIVAKLDRVDSKDAAQRAKQIEARRSVEIYTDEDGMVVVRARLAPEEGALFRKALEAARQELWEKSGTTARADALVLMADKSLSGTSRTGAERTMVVVHADDAVLRDGAEGESRIEDAGGVSAEAARRLSCDATVVRIENGEIGRRSRVISGVLSRAVRLRDEGHCRFPGCSARIVDAHHVQHWANGGATELANLISLCRRHHTLVHECGYRVQPDSAGGFRFFTPDGREMTPPSPESGTAVVMSDEAVARDRHRLMSTYEGGFVDYAEIGTSIGA